MHLNPYIVDIKHQFDTMQLFNTTTKTDGDGWDNYCKECGHSKENCPCEDEKKKRSKMKHLKANKSHLMANKSGNKRAEMQKKKEKS